MAGAAYTGYERIDFAPVLRTLGEEIPDIKEPLHAPEELRSLTENGWSTGALEEEKRKRPQRSPKA